MTEPNNGGETVGELLARIDRLEADNARLRVALVAMLEVQDEDCYLDHHGLCQAHHLRRVNGRPECEVALAKTALEAKP